MKKKKYWYYVVYLATRENATSYDYGNGEFYLDVPITKYDYLKEIVDIILQGNPQFTQVLITNYIFLRKE